MHEGVRLLRFLLHVFRECIDSETNMRNPAKALSTYIKENGLNPTTFGRRIQAPQGTVWRWLKEWTNPSPKYAVAIERETGIPAESWSADLAEVARLRRAV